MPTAEMKRRAVSFLGFTLILTLLLILFPTFEEMIRVYLAAKFGLIVAPDGIVTTVDGETPDRMVATAISLVVIVLHIVKIIFWMALVVAVVRFLGYLVIRTTARKQSASEITSLLKTVISIVIYIVSFFIIFQSQFPEVQLAPLFTGSTIIGIVVGLALQDTLGNLFSGLALQADQPFQVGDVITIAGVTGIVESVSWRGVKIRTFNNLLVVMSNSVLGKETITVAPRGNLNARSVFFNTLYNLSPTKTIQVVRDAVRQVENVSRKMRPVVRVRNLGDNGIDFEVKYWLDDYARHNDTDALIRQRIWYVFQREGLDFAYPTRTVYMEQKPAEMGTEETVNVHVERLSQVSIFAPLSEDEINELAKSSLTRVYAPGETIVKKGKEGNSMLVIIRGTVDVQVGDGPVKRSVSTLKENDFFGEMSLLTGEVRAATVVAIEETEVLRIDKKGLKPIIESKPQLASAIAELIDERRAKMIETIEAESEVKEDAKKKSVVRSIRKLFGLDNDK